MADIEVVDVPRDGNCFVSALFGAASDANIDLAGQLRLKPDACNDAGADRAYNTGFRRAMSKAIARFPKQYLAMHKFLTSIKDDTALFGEYATSMPPWQVKAFKQCKSAHTFVDLCVHKIRQPGAWFGHLEVKLVERMLGSVAGVKLIIHSADVIDSAVKQTLSTKMRRDLSESIMLVNLSGYHYMYVRRARKDVGQRREVGWLAVGGYRNWMVASSCVLVAAAMCVALRRVAVQR